MQQSHHQHHGSSGSSSGSSGGRSFLDPSKIQKNALSSTSTTTTTTHHNTVSTSSFLFTKPINIPASLQTPSLKKSQPSSHIPPQNRVSSSAPMNIPQQGSRYRSDSHGSSTSSNTSSSMSPRKPSSFQHTSSSMKMGGSYTSSSSGGSSFSTSPSGSSFWKQSPSYSASSGLTYFKPSPPTVLLRPSPPPSSFHRPSSFSPRGGSTTMAGHSSIMSTSPLGAPISPASSSGGFAVPTSTLSFTKVQPKHYNTPANNNNNNNNASFSFLAPTSPISPRLHHQQQQQPPQQQQTTIPPDLLTFNNDEEEEEGVEEADVEDPMTQDQLEESIYEDDVDEEGDYDSPTNSSPITQFDDDETLEDASAAPTTSTTSTTSTTTTSTISTTSISSSTIPSTPTKSGKPSRKEKEKKRLVQFDSFQDTNVIEEMVMDSWAKFDKTPRHHQSDTCIKILQDIYSHSMKYKEKKSQTLTTTTSSTTSTPTTLSTSTTIENKNNDQSIIIKKEKIDGKEEDKETQEKEKESNQESDVAGEEEQEAEIKDEPFDKELLDGGFKQSKNYLIQHAAGSGKSFTISCLTSCLYRLMEGDHYKYDLIIVLNDRLHLDTQLGHIVTKYMKKNNLYSYIKVNSGKMLLDTLNEGKKRVIITTMQKFVNMVDTKDFDMAKFTHRSIALISDEAHRTHGKAITRNIHRLLSGETRQSTNMTYFCFTCTPTPKCLEMFGEHKGNTRVPFYSYTLEQALKDGLVINAIDNYTTVAILTKITNTGKNEMVDKKRASYHLLKNSQNDRKILQEKAQYIIKHFVKLREMVNNDEFKCRAMLVTSSRHQIIVYKSIIEKLIRELPKDKRFDVIASFSPFVQRKVVKAESTKSINGKYAEYCKSRDGISNIIKDDKKCRVQLIIVADKLQTGFDEPSLGVMYVDKVLRGANAVQTIGRLSRTAPGKKAGYVVDFVNNRTDISNSFSSYWRETTLKGASKQTVLEMKLTKVLKKLSAIDPINRGAFQESIDYIIDDDERRKKEKRNGSIMDDLSTFLHLCDSLQWDNNQSPLNYKFITHLREGVNVKRSELSQKLKSIKGLLLNIQNESSHLGESTAKINVGETLPLNATRIKIGAKNAMSTTKDVINSLNSGELARAKEMLDNPVITSKNSDSMDLDADNLEFAKQIWSANPSIKLHKRLLTDDNDGIEFHPKSFNEASTIEQSMEMVIDFVVRNGQTFENLIHNQSFMVVFPFMEPTHPNHKQYKEKLAEALKKANHNNNNNNNTTTSNNYHHHHPHQLAITPVIQTPNLSQHHTHTLPNLKTSATSLDIVMSDNGSGGGGSLRTSQILQQIPIQDLPMNVSLPPINPDSIIGKPHTAGRKGDCLLNDCVASFCHDLESNDAGLRVFSVQTLISMTNEGIHKNDMHEVVAPINKLLLNRFENIGTKMIAIDLLGAIAVDETTLQQVLEQQLVGTLLKLIVGGDEPIRARSCRLLTSLVREVAIVSALLESPNTVQPIVQLLDSYDYSVTEHALRLLISLSNEERTIKAIRPMMDANTWSRLEHHKMISIQDLTSHLKTLLVGPKRTHTNQFQPSLSSTKRIRSSSLTKSN